MNQGQRTNPPISDAGADAGTPAARTAVLSAVVGASYTFDPAADGMAGIYAVRVLDRGGDPRALYAVIRADRGSSTEKSELRRVHTSYARALSFGRGSASHRPRPHPVLGAPPAEGRVIRFGRSRAAACVTRRWKWPGLPRVSRRLTATVAGLSLLLPVAVFVLGS